MQFSCPMHASSIVQLILFRFINLILFCRVQIMKLLITHFSPSSCHFLPLGPKYSPKHHPQMLTVYVLSFGWKVILHSLGAVTQNSNLICCCSRGQTCAVHVLIPEYAKVILDQRVKFQWTDVEVESKLMPNNHKLAYHFGLTNTQQGICTHKKEFWGTQFGKHCCNLYHYKNHQHA